MNSPKISIIIPSFNMVSFIEETLKSIFGQNYPNLEVIIQDGGSKDGTVDIIKKYAKKYPKVLYWESKKDKGQADAIDKGLKKATGGILAYLNADDVYEENTLNSVSEEYRKNPNALWFAGRGRVINGRGEEIAKAVTMYKNSLLNFNSYKLLLVTNYLMQPSVFITKRAYRLIGKLSDVDGIVMEYETWLKLGKIGMPVIINSILSSFRMSGGNISSKLFKKTLYMDEKIVRKYTNNPIILFFHKLNNIGRLGVVQSLGE